MKSNNGPWIGQVNKKTAYWWCRAYNQETSATAKGNCEYGMHDFLFFAKKCAKRKARQLNKNKSDVRGKGWFNA